MTEWRTLSCPSCGAPVEMGRFASMAVCDYCGSGVYLEDEAAKALGEMAILTEYPTPLYLHATGSLRGKRFTVVGRVRYRYSRGFWDEWYLSYDDGSYGWIADDEMELSLEHEMFDFKNVPDFENAVPGAGIEVSGNSLIIDEKDVAELEGAEGSLPWVMTKDQQFPYLEASQDDFMATVEYSEDGPEVFSGEWVSQDELKLDHPKDDDGGFGGWTDA